MQENIEPDRAHKKILSQSAMSKQRRFFISREREWYEFEHVENTAARKSVKKKPPEGGFFMMLRLLRMRR